MQLLGEFESVLNSLIRMKNVYVTGSNARFNYIRPGGGVHD